MQDVSARLIDANAAIGAANAKEYRNRGTKCMPPKEQRNEE